MIKRVAHTLFKFFFNGLSPRQLKNLMIFVIELLNEKGENFVTYLERPKKAANINFDPLGIIYENIAVVLQGPLIKEENFTYETVKLYFKTFPKITIIISTWDDIDIEVAKQFEAAGVILVLNQKPDIPGILNINLQIASTISGLKMAQQLGKDFVVKSRSDQRLYNPFFLSSLQLLDQYPIKLKNSPIKSRLVVSSMSTLKYRPLGISDMLMLGKTDDMVKYWDTALDDRKINFENVETVGEYASKEIAETYILSSFLKRYHLNSSLTLKNTWDVYANFFIILDKSSFNIYWFKYSRQNENRLDYYFEHIYLEMKFLEWISLTKTKNVPEYMLDQKLELYKP